MGDDNATALGVAYPSQTALYGAWLCGTCLGLVGMACKCLFPS